MCVKPVETRWCFHSAVSVFPFFQEVQSKSKVCANVFCGAGRECAVNEKGEPSCLCIEVSVGSADTKRQYFHAKKAGGMSWNYNKNYRLLRVFTSLSFCFLPRSLSRAVSPTRGQCVAATGRPTGITVSSTGMLVWRAWRSRWPTTDTATVRAAEYLTTALVAVLELPLVSPSLPLQMGFAYLSWNCKCLKFPFCEHVSSTVAWELS